MFKYLLLLPGINNLLRKVYKIHRDLGAFFQRRFRLSGIIKLQLDGKSFKMMSKGDDGIVQALYFKDDYVELNDLRVFKQLIDRESPVILDIGANTGIYSIIAALTSPKAHIYSFEPNPINLKRLKYNLKLNDLDRVKVVGKALGNENNHISFTVPQNDIISDTSSAVEAFSRSTYKGELEWKKIEVEQVSLDNFWDSTGLQSLDLIKIDVEGYEIPVLQGAQKSIARFRPIIILETFLNNDNRPVLINFLKEQDYHVYLILKEGIVWVEEDLPHKTGLNFLLLPFRSPQVFVPLSGLPVLLN